MCIVLPGESHPAENLDRIASSIDCTVDRQRSSRLSAQHGLELACLIGDVIDGLCCIPHQGRHLLDAKQQVREPVLHGLELTDGAAELDS